MTIRTLRAGITAFVMTVMAFLTPATAQTDISPEYRAAINEYLVAARFTDIMTQTFTGMMQQIMTEVQRESPNMPQEALQIVQGAVREEAQASLSRIVQSLFPIMVETYTVDEINQLTAFLRTPLGQKNVDMVPRILSEIETNLIPEMQGMAQRMDQKITERLRAAGYE